MPQKVSKLHYVDNWPSPQRFGEEVLLIYDKIFNRNGIIKKWIRQFPCRYGVTSGETLKDLQDFPMHMERILQLTESLSSRKLRIVVLGGGSVGDFGGFVASVYKRGVDLVHIPSTWLSAMDSAHGGKTALNVQGYKNQIGTFYPASEIYLIRPLLLAQPKERSFEALGELIKMALLTGGRLYNDLNRVPNLDSQVLWRLLPQVIQAKYDVVAKDPLEKSGYRHLLNFGHTMGHVFEAHYELPHGVAVLAGVQFALEWSYSIGLLPQKEYLELMQAPFWAKAVKSKNQSTWKNLSMMGLLSEKPQVFRHYLEKDKKKTAAQTLRFVLLQKPGKGVIKEVTLTEIAIEVQRQKDFWG